MMGQDEATQATNDDASSCKRFAVQQGYWVDPYIQHLVRGTAERRAPEINRGYFARVKGVQTLLHDFLKLTKGECQVINLGAGFDTTYWNLKDEGLAPKNFIEVDFPEVTARKCQYIKTRKPLLAKLTTEDGEIKVSRLDMHAADYHLVHADLRDLTQVQSQLSECSVDYNLPTVAIAECVLVYMDAERSANLLKWMAETFKTAFLINYEQVNMGDRFGQVMVQNLQFRNCSLPGIQYCADLESQKLRFTSQSWEGAAALDMTKVYQYLPQAEVQRIERLEFLDEHELLEQLFQHYCLVWAYKDGHKLGLEKITFSQR